MRNKYILTLLLTGCLLSAVAQDINKAKLDSLLNAIALNQKGMGSLALAENGAVVYQKAVGYASMGAQKIAATPQTHYRIGSITKMFTAVMIFQLIEEQKLSLTTPLATYFPQLTNAGKITIGMMLDHRSGLHNFTDDPSYATYESKPQTQAEMVATISRLPSDFEPDSKPQYSNTNFLLLGYIVEKLTGKTYSAALKQRITAKIGLNDTYYGGKINPAKDEASSFTYNDGWKEMPETDMSIPGGAGAIVSTPTDLVKFIDALFAGKLISAEHLELMKTMRDNYGMAMFKIPFYTETAYGHNGGIDGFTSVLAYFPEQKMAVAYCANGSVYAMNDVLIGVLSIYFKKPYIIPTFKAASVNIADLDKYLGVYSSTQIPLKVTVTKNSTALMAQATGQSAFELTPLGADKFEFKAAGIVMEFDPANHAFLLKQGGANYKFTLDK